MTVEQAVLEKLRGLPPERQQEVLDFVESLQPKIEPKRSRQSFMGIGANLGVSISKEDIDKARRQMWGNFPALGRF